MNTRLDAARRAPFGLLALTGAMALCAAAPEARAQAVTIDGGATVNVPGDHASPWAIGNALTVGGSGAGALNILGGGAVSNTLGTVGDLAASSGAVTVSGANSQWTNSGGLTVGNRGAGALSVGGGGGVSAMHGVIGAYALGTVDVDGPNSSWTLSDGLTLGAYAGGNGTLNITRGGKVTMASATTVISIGNDAGGVGVVNVDGPGSTMTINGPGGPVVARSGTGTLNITHGGQVFITDCPYTYVELDAGSVGTVKVDGAGSKWTMACPLIVGYSGLGSMSITHGGVVSNGAGYIGNQASSDDTVTVDGPGSTWANAGILYIGSVGHGVLTIRGGGLVTASIMAWDSPTSSGSGTINIGAAQGDAAALPGTLSTSFVQFGTRTSRMVFNHTDNSGAYVFAPAITSVNATADSAVNVLAGVTVMTGASTYYGPTTVSAGVLAAGAAHVFSANSGYAVQSAGTLRLGDDQTIASLSNAGAVDLAADGQADAALTVTGAYAGSGGALILNTVLGDDASATDKLIAGSTSGATTLRIVNAGGLGAQTTGDGIQVVQVLGASDGAFTLASRVIAGHFEYELVQGADGNWYLQSKPYIPPAATGLAIPALSAPALALLALLLIASAAALRRRYK